MANVLTRGTMLPPRIVETMFSGVKGHSALARVTAQDPMAFNGNEYFVFDMDKEADIVGENLPKSNGGGTVTSVIARPVKFEYGMRVSDEFRYGTEEYRISVLERFAEGAARKFARGLDIGAFHGENPRTKAASQVIGDMHFDQKVQTTITYDATAPDTNLESAVATIQGADGEVNGLVMAPTFASAMASLKVNGVPQYPEFRFGRNPEGFYGMNTDVNGTVNFDDAVDMAIVGDFANAFKWGYAKEIPLEVIEYGNPDNDAEAGDLKGHNQVYLRAEAYIGWAILDPTAFARIVTGA